MQRPTMRLHRPPATRVGRHARARREPACNGRKPASAGPMHDYSNSSPESFQWFAAAMPAVSPAMRRSYPYRRSALDHVCFSRCNGMKTAGKWLARSCDCFALISGCCAAHRAVTSDAATGHADPDDRANFPGFRQSRARDSPYDVTAVPAPAGTPTGIAAARAALTTPPSAHAPIDARAPLQRITPDHDPRLPARSPHGPARRADRRLCTARRSRNPVRGMRIGRASASPPPWNHGVHHACLSIVGQGAKSTRVGDETYVTDESRMMVATANLPSPAA